MKKTNTSLQQSKDQKKTNKSIRSNSPIKKSPEIKLPPKSQDTPNVDLSKSDSTNLPKSIQQTEIEFVKSNLPTTELYLSKNSNKSKIDSDNESTNSTIDKMQDFLSQHEIESSLSVQDSLQPIESSVSASYPLDYKQLELEKKEIIPKIKTIKQVVESRRSDFEEIKAHLERRYAEMKKRVKKIGDKEDEIKEDKKSDKSLILSYHSTEFTPDLDMNLFKKENDSLTNLDRLKNAIDKELNQQKAVCQNLKQKSRVDECGFTTHAIFAHLAKLQNVKKAVKSSSKCDLSKIDKTFKDNIKDDKMKNKSKETIKTETIKEENNLIDNKSNNENVKIQSKDSLKREDSDQSLSFSSPKGSSQSIKSITSIKSLISKDSKE